MEKVKLFDIPILFIIFNRKAVTQSSFDAIKVIKPRKLYIASDGARDYIQGEKDIVEDTRKTILDMIDWECEVKTLFQTRNLGCGIGVYTAISWLFENEEKGIILEDDCVAQESFFHYADELLELYRLDERIAMIAGFNKVGTCYSESSYCFSKYKACWGWATWRRAWRNMDINMKWRESEDYNSILSNIGYQAKDIKYWKYRLKAIDKNYVSAWDWQWYFSISAQNQLSIFPKNSLISNIGFGADSTHTKSGNIENYKSKKELLFPLVHPNYIVPNIAFDNLFYKKNNSFYNRISTLTPRSIKNFIRRILN